jgi:hypothetical protein
MFQELELEAAGADEIGDNQNGKAGRNQNEHNERTEASSGIQIENIFRSSYIQQKQNKSQHHWVAVRRSGWSINCKTI